MTRGAAPSATSQRLRIALRPTTITWKDTLRLRCIRPFGLIAAHPSATARRRRPSIPPGTGRDAPTKGGMRPFRRVFAETVLHWIEVNVVHMRRQIPLVADRVLPISPLPDAALATADHDRRSRFTDAYAFRKPFLDRAPTAWEIGVVFRQCPQAVHVVGKHDPGVDLKGCAGADPSNRIPQHVDLPHQQIRPTLKQVHREEECSTWNPIATIFRHDRTMRGFGEGRKALPRGSSSRAKGFSALRVLNGFTPIRILSS